MVRDKPPILNGVVLAIADTQSDVGIGFQREGYAGGVLGNFQLKRVRPKEDRRVVDRPPLEGDRLTGRERAAACRRRSSSFTFHFRRERAVDDDARSKDYYPYEVSSGSKRRVGAGGNEDLLGACKDLVGGVVIDRPPVLKLGVLAIADQQFQVGIGFQREGYAGGVVGNFQLI